MPECPTSVTPQAPAPAPDTTLVVLDAAPDGTFTGALMPMPTPLDTRSQWQTVLDGILAHATRLDPTGDLDGLYAFWWPDMPDAGSRGLLMTRVHSGPLDTSTLAATLPPATLALAHVLTDHDAGLRMATLAIRGYIADTTATPRADRILTTVLTTTGDLIAKPVDRPTGASARLLAGLLLDRLDRQLP